MIEPKKGNISFICWLDEEWLIPAAGWSCSVGRARGGFWELWCTEEQPSVWMHAAARCQTAPPERPSRSTSHISEHRESKHAQCDILQWFHFLFKPCDKTAGTDQPWVGLTEGAGSALDVDGCPLKCCCLQYKTFPIPESMGQSPAQHCYTQTHIL